MDEAQPGAVLGSSLHEQILRRVAATGQAETVEFLSDPGCYAHRPASVQVIETHMALVFLAGETAYKMKRAAMLRNVDMRQLAARRHFCMREVELNRQLAPGVYLGNAEITREANGALALDGRGKPIEALVVMRRLDASQGLDQRILQGNITAPEIDTLSALLANFYLHQPTTTSTAEEFTAWWRELLEQLCSSLSDPQFALEPALVDPALEFLTSFLRSNADMLRQLIQQARIVDGHGDLKPEHVIMGSPLLVIDRIEFDDRLRMVDPFAEIVFLGLECERLGASWISGQLTESLAKRLGSNRPLELLQFYWCYHACMRARLSIEHLLDEAPRTPERWPRKTREYLKLARKAFQS